MNQFIGMTVHTRAGQAGVIDGAFGKSGKFKVTFPRLDLCDPIAAALAAGDAAAAMRAQQQQHALHLQATSSGSGAASSSDKEKEKEKPQLVPLPSAPGIKAGDPLYLRFRKFLYEPQAKGSDGKSSGASNRMKQN